MEEVFIMRITGMAVGPSSHPAFREKLEFKFDKQVNLFIGPNATGKSSLLRVLADRGLIDKTAILPFPPIDITISSDWKLNFENRTGLSVDESGFDGIELLEIPWIYIPATRIVLPSEFDWDDQVEKAKDTTIAIDNIEWQDNARIFDGRWVEDKCKFLFDTLKKNTNEDSKNFFGFLNALRTAYSCAKSIASEILIGRPSNHVSHPYELIADPWDFDPLFAEPYVHPGMGVSINQGENSTLRQYVGDLSAGTQGVYLWVLYISLKIWWKYMIIRGGTERSAWKNQPAILLIDEIENHLHPAWQRRVIPALLEHFPGLQIFATTHSPFVVAGLKAGQVHLLNRDENGRVTATTNTEDVIGWTADEILRTMMGVDDPTDAATAAAARELRQLRQEPPRDTPEDEERRQQRIAELRQKVDRDLLAGGPMKARREEFERQFAEALEKRLQSQNLNPENG